MKLYLVQHGEACAKEIDPDRPLTQKGREDMDRLAGFLQQAGIRVARVIHSGKLRAVQTAECLGDRIALGIELEASDSINPNDDPKGLYRQIEAADSDTLVVGHLPFMAKLVSRLVVGDEEKLITAYRPGSVVCLELTNDLRWQIDWMLRPELFR
ncbi:MAG: phosphohistidine phosphatase SixA [gamma proteobacterium symbiont of Ctena orbiculata]|nr:phosphohistidine phosphatase SixA [Candidatus Thiodiazotropha taylori]PUB84921.1 MAG: phosphohistidine phosphatase SixA [gamma proteobacterium symbiont of Ctena orbiculata]MBT2997960.1 phosphohistidine phosphatase SixA [Candidatus Thiodiazotropha taylori]MBT3001748.1 phosphohistidine phosphatase SixA [Candidatus Thiodiazotropha taylori]MBT3028439.1 phosphohistidine phosphatase SixA [Candidatus Thiodiazotropha taylori]